MAENPKAKKKSTSYLIILIAVLPILLWIGREIVHHRTIWYFRAADLADLIILAPLYLLILLFLFIYMWRYKAPTSLMITFIVFCFVFMYGHSMHFTANSINTFITEVRNYREILPADTYALVFFLDERLSHLILFAAVVGLIACWFIFDRMKLAPPVLPGNLPILIILGAAYGIVQAYALIEARMVYLTIPIFLIIMGLWIYLWRRSDLAFGKFVVDRPFTTFVTVMLITSVLAVGIYGLIFNEFPQPSEFIYNLPPE